MGTGLSLGSVVRDEERRLPVGASARSFGKPEVKARFRSGEWPELRAPSAAGYGEREAEVVVVKRIASGPRPPAAPLLLSVMVAISERDAVAMALAAEPGLGREETNQTVAAQGP